jgi:teichuronic acid biosynthesis protein TuaE
MSVGASTRPAGAPGRPGTQAAAVALALAAAVVAGALAVYAPIPGIALGVVLITAVLLGRATLPALGRTAVGVAMIAALAGPNLAVPGAQEAFAFRLVAILIILGIGTWLIMGRGLPLPAGLGWPAALAAGWVSWALVSTLWAPSPAAALRWTIFLFMMTGLMLAIPVAASTHRRLAWFLGGLGAFFMAAVGVAILEIATGFRLPTSALSQVVGAFAATSFFGNQNNFATYLALTLPYLLVLPVVARDVRLRIMGGAGAVVAILLILFSGSKANLVAVGLILVGLLVVLAADPSMRKAFRAAVVVVGAALLLIVPSMFGAGVVPLPEQAAAKLDFRTLVAQVESGSGSGAVRGSLLSTGLDIAAQSGGVGVGAGNAEVVVRGTQGYEGVANLHNWALEVLVDTGVIGLVLFGALYAIMLVGNLRVARRTHDPWLRYMGLAGSLALLGFLTGSLGPSTAIHFAPMWITFGLCLTTIVLARRTGADGSTT